MRVLYVGNVKEGGTCLMRMRALEDLGCEVVPVDTYPEHVRSAQNRFWPRVMHKLGRPPDLAGANDQIVCKAESEGLDILWLDRALTIWPETLRHVRRKLPNAVVVGYSPDDMAARHNQSVHFLKSLPLYDVYFTTKTYGVEELMILGCPRAEFVGNAYDKHTHRPMPIRPGDRERLGGPVGFIGAWEKERVDSLLFLARHGVQLRIWGGGWERCRRRHGNMVLERKPVWSDDYARAICAFDINLCFLRKINRDLQTQRSVEIPACGAFMLAERTDEHLELFEEGKEAEFFGSDDELLDKVRYYLKHDGERKRIAVAGRERCLKSGYSYHERLRDVLKKLGHLPERR